MGENRKQGIQPRAGMHDYNGDVRDKGEAE